MIGRWMGQGNRDNSGSNNSQMISAAVAEAHERDIRIEAAVERARAAGVAKAVGVLDPT